MQKKGAEIIIETLERLGVSIISGIPGGSNLPIYDALSKSRKIRHILARHEQGAGFIAQGIARTTGRAGVCFATSGPGVTNLLTAIADARLDSVPLVAITGQVPLSLIGTDAFQEVDTYGLSLPITKHNFFITCATQIESTLIEAFRIAECGRPGPVLIDIPKDIQNQIIDFEPAGFSSTLEAEKIPDPSELAQIAQKINLSKSPILYIGGGLINSDASDLAINLAEKASLPVVSTLMGLGAFSDSHPLFYGMSGMHGSPFVNRMMQESDLLLVMGARLNDRATGRIEEFSKKAAVIHFDIDSSEIEKIRKTDGAIIGDLRIILKSLLPLIEPTKRISWIEKVDSIRTNYPMPKIKDDFHPAAWIRKIGEAALPDSIIVTDVGQHQMWTAQHYPFQRPRTFLTSGGLGTMGFGLPTAIGAAIANPDKKVYLFTGDGSILMNLQELILVSELNLNITILLLNNRQLGLVRQQQEYFFGGNYFSSHFQKSPDFQSISKGFGIQCCRIESAKDFDFYFREIIMGSKPHFFEIMSVSGENVLPIVPPGKSNIEMIEE